MKKDRKEKGNVPNLRRFPNLRFPEFEGEWETVKIKDCLNCHSSTLMESAVIEKSGIYPVYGATGIITYTPNYEIDNDAILIIKDGSSVGKVQYAKNKYSVIGTLNYLTPKENVNLKYLYYYLQTFNFDKYKVGSGIPHIYFKDYGNEYIYCPLIEEQTKTAYLLQLIDDRISTQSQIVEELETLMKGLSKKLFSQQLRFKNDNGNDYPDWKNKNMGDIATITTGSSNREDSVLDGKYIFFDRSQDIRTSHIYLFDKEAIIVPGEGQKFIPQYYIGKFDLHQRAYAIFDFVDINGKFLYYYILNEDRYLQSQAVGSTVKSLRLPMFQSMPIKTPYLQEQTNIANFLSAIDEKIETEKQILRKYTEQKKYLLANMFI